MHEKVLVRLRYNSRVEEDEYHKRCPIKRLQKFVEDKFRLANEQFDIYDSNLERIGEERFSDEISTLLPKSDLGQPVVELSVQLLNTRTFVDKSAANNTRIFTGLINESSFCYLNSLLQCLYMTPEIRNAFFEWEFKGEEHEKDKSIPYQLQWLFLKLFAKMQPSIDTDGLKRAFGWTDQRGQHDWNEMFLLLFESLENSWVDYSVLKRLCEGHRATVTQCSTCGNSTVRKESFINLDIPIVSHGGDKLADLDKSMQFIRREEKLTGSDRYLCGYCQQKSEATRRETFIHFPDVFCMQLMRVSASGHSLTKLADQFKFSLDETDLTDFVEPSNQSMENRRGDCEGCSELDEHTVECALRKGCSLGRRRESFIYRLHAIVMHSGNLVGGHYFAFIRDPDTDRWFRFDDQTITQVHESSLHQAFGTLGASSSFCASTNASFLIFRRNRSGFMPSFHHPPHLPSHIQQRLDGMLEEERERRRIEQYERSKTLKLVHTLLPHTHELTKKHVRLAGADSLRAAADDVRAEFAKTCAECRLLPCRLVPYDAKCMQLSPVADEEATKINEISGDLFLDCSMQSPLGFGETGRLRGKQHITFVLRIIPDDWAEQKCPIEYYLRNQSTNSTRLESIFCFPQDETVGRLIAHLLQTTYVHSIVLAAPKILPEVDTFITESKMRLPKWLVPLHLLPESTPLRNIFANKTQVLYLYKANNHSRDTTCVTRRLLYLLYFFERMLYLRITMPPVGIVREADLRRKALLSDRHFQEHLPPRVHPPKFLPDMGPNIECCSLCLESKPEDQEKSGIKVLSHSVGKGTVELVLHPAHRDSLRGYLVHRYYNCATLSPSDFQLDFSTNELRFEPEQRDWTICRVAWMDPGNELGSPASTNELFSPEEPLAVEWDNGFKYQEFRHRVIKYVREAKPNLRDAHLSMYQLTDAILSDLEDPQPSDQPFILKIGLPQLTIKRPTSTLFYRWWDRKHSVLYPQIHIATLPQLSWLEFNKCLIPFLEATKRRQENLEFAIVPWPGMIRRANLRYGCNISQWRKMDSIQEYRLPLQNCAMVILRDATEEDGGFIDDHGEGAHFEHMAQLFKQLGIVKLISEKHIGWSPSVTKADAHCMPTQPAYAQHELKIKTANGLH